MPTIPYMDSTVKPERSQQRIMALLAKFGVEELGFGMADPTIIEVHFVHQGLRVRIPFSARPLADAYLRLHPNSRKSTADLLEQARNAAWRFAEHWLKVTLEAVEFGLIGIEDAFLPHYADRDGQRLGPAIEARLRMMGPEQRDHLCFEADMLRPALPAARVIDAECEDVVP